MVGCEIRLPSDDVHGYKVLTCWYTHEAIDSCVQSLRKGLHLTDYSISVTQKVNT